MRASFFKDQEGLRRCAGYSRSLRRLGIRSEDLGQARYTAAGGLDAYVGVTLSGSGLRYTGSGSAWVRASGAGPPGHEGHGVR